MLKRIFQMILPISSTDFDTQNEDLVRQKRQKVGGGELATNESNITLRADRKTKKNQLSPPPQEVPTPKLPGATGRCKGCPNCVSYATLTNSHQALVVMRYILQKNHKTTGRLQNLGFGVANEWTNFD